MLYGVSFPITEKSVQTIPASELVKAFEMMTDRLIKHKTERTEIFAGEDIKQYYIVRNEIQKRLYRMEDLEK